MIIDMRLRPPIPSIVRSVLYQGAGTTDHPDFLRLPSTRERSIPMLIQEMDTAGIATGVIPGRYSLEPFGQIPNEELATLFQENIDRFVGFLGLDLRWTTGQMLDEINRWMGKPGFVGVSLEPSIALEPTFAQMDDRRLYPIYEECVRRNIPVNVTLSGALQSITRQPYERSHPTQVYQVAIDFPKLDIHIAHGGYPWVMEMIGICMACPNVWLSPDLYMVGLFPGAQDYAKAALNYLSSRTLFGSNYPTKPFTPMIDAYKAWGWPKDVQSKIFGENAKRLLRLA